MQALATEVGSEHSNLLNTARLVSEQLSCFCRRLFGTARKHKVGTLHIRVTFLDGGTFPSVPYQDQSPHTFFSPFGIAPPMQYPGSRRKRQVTVVIGLRLDVELLP